MATLAQLRAEPWWDREIVTPQLRWLGDRLCAAYGRPRSAAGDKGNTAHLDGAHRSQEWIKNSRWCLNRTYTVQRGLTALQARHVAGFDFTPGAWGTADNRAKVAVITRRLVAAGTAGRLPGVWEVIGTLDGKRAIGIDLPEGQTWPASFDHVDHNHLTFDRRLVGDQQAMERVLTAALSEEETVDKAEWLRLMSFDDAVKAPDNWPSGNKALSLSSAVTELLKRAVHADRQLVAQAEAIDKGMKATGDALASQTTALTQIAASLANLVALVERGGGDPDLAALIAKIEALAAAVSGVQTGLATVAAAVETARTDSDALRARLATAFAP